MIDANESMLSEFLKAKGSTITPPVIAGSPPVPVAPVNPMQTVKQGIDNSGQMIDSVVKILDSLNSLANSPIVKTLFTPDRKEARMNQSTEKPKQFEEAQTIKPVKEEEKKPVVQEVTSIDKAMLIWRFTEEFLGMIAKETPNRPIKEIFDELVENKEAFIMGLQTRFNLK